MEVSKLVRQVDRKVLKRYFSGENLDVLCRRYGVSRSRVLSLAEDYKSGKIDIFDENEKRMLDKNIEKHSEEVLRLRERISELEECLRMAKIKEEGYEIMLRIAREAYGIDLPKKVDAKQSASSGSSTRK